MDLDLAALTCQVLRGDLFPVQIIGDLLRHRRLPGRGALIVDVISVGLPDQLAAVPGKGLVSLDILDLLQYGFILDRVLFFRVLEPVGNRDVALFSVGVRKNINSLLLGSTGGNLSHRIRNGLLQSCIAGRILFLAVLCLHACACLCIP